MHVQPAACYAWLLHSLCISMPVHLPQGSCHKLPPCAHRNLSGNALEGPLPAEWGLNSTWPRLTSLSLDANPSLESDLPTEWATSGGFQQLKVTACSQPDAGLRNRAVSDVKSATSHAVKDSEHAPCQHRKQRLWLQ